MFGFEAVVNVVVAMAVSEAVLVVVVVDMVEPVDLKILNK